MNPRPYFLMTVDVETFSFGKNKYQDRIAEEVRDVGLPRLLELFKKYKIRSTFFFTGNIAKLEPSCVRMVREAGHEIGCHGYSHELDRAFDLLSYEEQVRDLFRAKEVIEPFAGEIVAFRAPAARINEDTIRALEKTGFRIDSSVAPQRFDGPLTFGAVKKLDWLRAPRMPYFLSHDSISSTGNSEILEVPISAALVPYIGTTMRISPLLTRLVQRILFIEARKTLKPIVFLFHPNECLDHPTTIKTTRRAKGTLSYYLGDQLRHRLKLRNLGLPSLKLLESVIEDALSFGFEFICMSEYLDVYTRRTG